MHGRDSIKRIGAQPGNFGELLQIVGVVVPTLHVNTNVLEQLSKLILIGICVQESEIDNHTILFSILSSRND